MMRLFERPATVPKLYRNDGRRNTCAPCKGRRLRYSAMNLRLRADTQGQAQPAEGSRGRTLRGCLSKLQAGSYQLDAAGTGFTIGGREYLVRKRNEHTAAKPSRFIISVNPYQYVSSLYPTARGDVYGIEVGRVWYALKFKAGEVVLWEPRFLAPATDDAAGTAYIRRERVSNRLECKSPSRK